MTKPQLNLRCQIGFSGTPASNINTVTWTDVTSYLRLQDGVSLYRGRQDETSTVGAGNASFTLNNRDGRFTPGNTSGAYSPNVKIRRPVRFSRCRYDAEAVLATAPLWLDAQFSTSSQTVPNLGTAGATLNGQLGSTSGSDSNDPQWLAYTGTSYAYFPGSGANCASVPNASNLQITSDLTVIAKVNFDSVAPAGAASRIIGKRAGSAQGYEFQLRSTGLIELQWRDSGTGSFRSQQSTVTLSSVGIDAGEDWWLAATLDADNGAGGHTVRFWYSADGVTWTQLGADRTSATAVVIVTGTDSVEVGAMNSSSNPLAGRVYRAMIQSGIGTGGNPGTAGATTILDIDFTTLTSGAATSFTATTGQTVTINRAVSGRKTVVVTANSWLYGTDDYAAIPDNASLNFTAAASFSVGWTGREWPTPASGGALVAKRTTGAGYALTQTSTTQGATFTISDGTNTATATSPAPSAGALRSYLAVVDRASQTLTVYCDGVAGTPVSITSVGNLTNTEELRIGRLSGASTSYSDAEDFAVAVVGSALTAQNVADISTYYATRTYNSAFTAPYMPIWTGYVEQWGNGWNQGVQPVVRVQASDLMARLANRTMRSLAIEEALYDSPVLFYPMNDASGATAAGNQSTTASLATMPVTQAGSGGTATFGTASTMGADPSQTCLVLTRSDASNGKYLTQTYNPISLGADWTMEAFVYLPVSVTGQQRLLEIRRVASNETLAIDLDTNVPKLRYVDSSGTSTAVLAGTSINDGAWHLITAVNSSSSGATSLYVDGTWMGDSFGYFMSAALTQAQVTVGASGTGTLLFNGWVSGVAVYPYDQVTYTTSRIAQHALCRTGATGESSLARFNRIVRLSVGSWATSSSAYTPSATMSAQPFDGKAAASLLYEVQDAELAPVYIAASGIPQWQSRSQRTSTATTTSLSSTLVDSSTGYVRSPALMVNTATYSRPGGSTVTVTDATARTAYGPCPDIKTIYYSTDAQLTAAANYVVNSRKDEQTRTGALTTDLVTTDATTSATTLLALDVGSVLQVTSVPLGSITTVSVFVEGANDSITPDSWRRTWNTSPLRAGGQAWVLGSSTYSVLGSTTTLGA